MIRESLRLNAVDDRVPRPFRHFASGFNFPATNRASLESIQLESKDFRKRKTFLGRDNHRSNFERDSRLKLVIDGIAELHAELKHSRNLEIFIFFALTRLTYGVDEIILVREPKLELELEVVVLEEQEAPKFLLRVARQHWLDDVAEVFAETVFLAFVTRSIVVKHLRLVFVTLNQHVAHGLLEGAPGESKKTQETTSESKFSHRDATRLTSKR